MGTDKRRVSVAVVGAGAAGCIAAAAAASKGARVILYEKNDRIGRKLAATGNGRCNLTNLDQDITFYHTSEESGLYPDKESGAGSPAEFFDEFASVLSREQDEDEKAWAQEFRAYNDSRSSVSECMHLLVRLFNSFGLCFHERGGYVYPRTDSAASVVQVLERKLKYTGVDVRCSDAVRRIERQDPCPGDAEGCFKVTATGTEYVQRVILACGSPAGPHLGACAQGYELAKMFGHRIAAPLPALTGLLIDDKLLRIAGGVRCEAGIEIFSRGRRIPGARERGELQITAEGISGIPVFQLSRSVSLLINAGEEEDITAQIDFLPEFGDKEWQAVKQARLAGAGSEDTLAGLFTGLVHPKVASYIIRRQGYADEKKIRNLGDDRKEEIAGALLDMLRGCSLPVRGTGGFEKAQAACGGVVLSELTPAMESRLCKGLYITGEMTDIDGRCGGYNLTYAFCSGFTAGNHAAQD